LAFFLIRVGGFQNHKMVPPYFIACNEDKITNIWRIQTLCKELYTPFCTEYSQKYLQKTPRCSEKIAKSYTLCKFFLYFCLERMLWHTFIVKIQINMHKTVVHILRISNFWPKISLRVIFSFNQWFIKDFFAIF